ncbi:MAG: DUF1156 domain-containing protein [Phycisphaerales bacterium]
MHLPKRLIEVDLPIARISAHSRREKSIRHGHISTLHIWWARRPLAACRAVVLASLWPDPVDLATWGDDDPTIKPDRFLREAREQLREFAPHVEQLLWDKKASPETANAFAEIVKKPALLDGPDSPILLRSLLLHFIADFSNWDNSTDPLFLYAARTLTQAAHESLGGQPGVRPIVIDPFAGGGSIPLEALRVGADAFASDLNPIPVLLNKVVLEYIPKYGQRLADDVRRWGEWIKEQAEEELAQFYPAQKLKTDAYFPQPKPKIELRGGGTWYLDGIAAETPIAYLWARTVLSDAPGQGEIPVEIPLMRSMWLAKKTGRKQALRWVRDENGKVKTRTVDVTYYVQGEPVPRRVKRPILEIFHPMKDSEVVDGTVARGHATCPVTGHVTPVESVREQLKRRRGGAYDARLFAVVTTLTTKRYTGRRDEKNFQGWSEQGRFYRLPTKRDDEAFAAAIEELSTQQSRVETNEPSIVPDEIISLNELRRISVPIYGMERWGDLFSARQALALSTLARLVREVGERLKAGEMPPAVSKTCASVDGRGSKGNRGMEMFAESPGVTSEANTVLDDAYPHGMAEAVQTCLAMAVGRQADYGSALCRWVPPGEFIGNTFGRQAIGMIWDFAEVPTGSVATGGFSGAMNWVAGALEANISVGTLPGQVAQASATNHPLPDDSVSVLVTDPPYYDAVPYAYLSDFFYVWFRRTLVNIHPSLTRDGGVPKEQEIVVDRPHKLSKSNKDIHFYERELARAFADSRRVVRPDGIGCIVFASKSTSSWEAILKAVIEAGWIVTGSWPIDTEMETRVAAQGQARLGSSVHIVVRPRELPTGELDEGEVGDWRSVLEELPKRIREWMPRLDAEGVVGADAIFACLGPALEVFSRYSRVERASGEAVLLPEYLEHVWATVSTEALSLIFQDADAGGLEPDARLTAMWLWTLRASKPDTGSADSDDEENGDDEDDEIPKPAGKPARGFALEFDAARKIAQGLGVHLEKCQSFVEVKGETARLLSMAERVRHLFGKEAAADQLGAATASKPKGRKKKGEPNLFQSMEEVKAEIEAAEAQAAGKLAASKPGATVLDRVHQAMLLFSTGRGEALRRFIVDDGVGQDARFWKLADSLNKLYPIASEERRAVEGVLARKKSFGF